MSLKRRIIAAGGSIALALTGALVGVSANAAETDLNIDANTQGIIRVTSDSGVEHTFNAYKLASYSNAKADGNKLTSFDVTTEPAVFSSATQALNDMGEGTNYTNSVYAENGRNNPIGYAAATFASKSSQMAQFAKALKARLQASNVAPTKTGLKTNTDNQVSAGYYLLADTTANLSGTNSGDTASDAIIVSSTIGNVTKYTSNGADAPLGEIELKASTLPIFKQVVTKNKTKQATSDDDGAYFSQDNPAYGFGDEVDYQLMSKTPDFTNHQIDPTLQDAKKTRQYAITDTMSAGLTYKGVEYVQLYKSTKNADGSTTWTLDRTLNNGTDYDVTTAAATTATSGSRYDGGTIVRIDLKKYVNKAAGSSLASSSEEILAGEKVVVIINTTLNKNALVSTPGAPQGNPNKVELEFSNNPSDESQMTPVTGGEVEVYTFKLNVHKTAMDGTTAIPGVEFKIKAEYLANQPNAPTNPNSGKWLKGQDAEGNWEYTSDENEAKTFTTDAQGNLEVKGLKAGQYEVKETKAGNGYMSASTQGIDFTVSIQVDYDSDRSTAATTLLYSGSADHFEGMSGIHWGDQTVATKGEKLVLHNDINGHVEVAASGNSASFGVINVKNAKNFTELPLTGATGMRLLAIFAIIAAAGAALLIVRARRVRSSI